MEGEREGENVFIPMEKKYCFRQFLCRSFEDALFVADLSEGDREQPWGSIGGGENNEQWPLLTEGV